MRSIKICVSSLKLSLYVSSTLYIRRQMRLIEVSIQFCFILWNRCPCWFVWTLVARLMYAFSFVLRAWFDLLILSRLNFIVTEIIFKSSSFVKQFSEFALTLICFHLAHSWFLSVSLMFIKTIISFKCMIYHKTIQKH